MFENFNLSGLTMSELTQQVTALLNNPFITGAILAVLALPFARKIARTIKSIVGGR